MKAYVINLKSRKDRLDFFNKNTRPTLEKLGFEIEIFEAIDGFEITQDQWKRGRYGCFASHVSIYRKAIKAGLQEFAVFEDDVVLGSADIEKVQELLNKPPRRWDVLYVAGGLLQRHHVRFFTHAYQLIWARKFFERVPFLKRFFDKQNKKSRWIKAKLGCTTTAGMIIKTSFIEKFLHKTVPPNQRTSPKGAVHIDWELIRYIAKRPFLKVYLLEPQLLIQNIASATDNAWYEEYKIDPRQYNALEDHVKREPEWELAQVRGGIGGAFLTLAACSFLEKNQCTHKEINYAAATPCCLLSVRNPYLVCDDVVDQLRKIENKERKIIVFPTTISRNHPVLKEAQNFSNITFFVVDKKSLKRCKRKGIRAFLATDVIFDYKPQVCPEGKVDKTLFSYCKEATTKRIKEYKIEEYGVFDNEYDISQKAGGSQVLEQGQLWTKETAAKCMKKISEELCTYKTITTNHLYVGVLSLLLGRQVCFIHLFTDYYPENQSVILGVYPKCTLR